MYLPKIFKLCASTLFVLTASASITSVSVSAAPVRIGLNTWIGFGPLYIAEKLGTFKKYGVDVKFVKFQDGSLVPPAIESNALDGGAITYDQVIRGAAKDLTQKVVLTIDYSNGADAIVADSSIKSIKDFKGKKVVFSALTPSDFLLAYALQKNNMTKADILPANLPAEAVPSALISGAAPIGVTFEPNVSQIIKAKSKRNFKVIFSTKEAPGLITDVLVFKKNYISSNPKEVKSVIQAYFDSLDYMKRNPKKANAIIGQWMGISEKDVQDQLTGVFNPSLKEMMVNFTKSDKIDSYYRSGAIISDVLIKNKQTTKIPQVDETLDSQFLSELLKAAKDPAQ